MSPRHLLNAKAPRKRVAVIGAGVVGLACALRLKRDGHEVRLYDPETPGSQTSYGNAALIMTAQNTPLSAPGIWKKIPAMLLDSEGPLTVRWRDFPQLARWFLTFLGNSNWRDYERIADTLTPMVTRSLTAWQDLVETAAAQRLFRQDGLLYVFRKPENLAAAGEEAEFRRRFGIQSEFIPPEGLHQMEPALGNGLAGGIFYPESAHTADPAALSAHLLATFQQLGGVLRPVKVDRLAGGGDGPLTLETAEGPEEADEAVVAAGIWSPPLVAPFGVKPLLAAERGYHLMLPEPCLEVRRPIAAGDHKFIVTPLAGGIRLAGTAEFTGIDAEPNWRRSDVLLPLARRLLPGLGGVGAVRWMGRRPSSADGLPSIGRTKAEPRVTCAFGHGHLGLTLAAVTSEIVSDMLARRPLAEAVEAVRPER
jgi:glycine/D-amino acid oxidase-like deaminating enzyme